MRIYHYSEINEIKRNVACIGYFDGVHIGHQKLIEETVKLAREKNLYANCITFYPDPETIINKKDVFELTSLNRRMELLEQYGIENVLLLDFNEELMKKSADDFISDYIVASNVDSLICGFDFRFGYKASGNVELLKKNSLFQTVEIPEIKYDEDKISSTRIRKLIKENNILEARKMLGHE